MTQLSPHQVLLNAYPGKIRSEEGDRIKIVTIRPFDTPDDLGHIRTRLAQRIGTLDEEYINYLQEATEQQERAARSEEEEEPTDEAADDSGDLPPAIQRRQQRDQGASNETADGEAIEISYSEEDIEFAELTRNSQPIGVPYPRAYRCPRSCGHFTLLSPSSVPQRKHCQHHLETQLRRFPYLFVCPRCGNYEQASPHRALQDADRESFPQEIVSDDIDRDTPLNCPEDGCSGHLHVNLGDRLRNVYFECYDCYSRFPFNGDCPKCHKPGVDGTQAVQSEMRPKPIDANITEPLMLNDIESSRGTTLPELRETSQKDAQNDEPFHWNLEKVASGSSDTIRDTFAVEDVFTVEDIDTVSATYGYQSTVTSRNTDLDQHGRLARTFDSEERKKRAYLTRQRGRGIVVDLDTDVIAEIVSGGEAGYRELAEDELAQIDEMPPEELSETNSLRLVPLLHAYQHAFYEAAIEQAGLENFLAAKLLVEKGAIVFAEQRQVGTGGLTQVTLNQTGATLLDVFQRTEELLEDCSRDCDDACLACVFIDDANCHPFVSREVEGYVPANSLLDRELASRMIRRA